MKKILSIFLILVLALCVFSACKSGNTDKDVADPPDKTEDGGEEITTMYITVNGKRAEVTLADNSATAELVKILKNSDIVYYADDYGGFEKVGNLGHTLPKSDTQITTEAGDIMLYLGNQIVIFYGSNSWSYTRLGKINGYSAEEIASLLGAGQGRVQITLSLK